MIRQVYLLTWASLLFASSAAAQSASLYVQETVPTKTVLTAAGRPNQLSPSIGRDSFTAVSMPTPRKFSVHDQVVIVVRESTETDIESDMDTKKETDVQGRINAMPRLSITDLLNLQLKNSAITDPPRVDVSFSNEFKGEGSYSRKDTFTSRLTATIIDIKPNGTMVLEARKFIKSDKESLEMILTGVCRKDDITADNTVLSTQLADLNIIKKHTGDVRRATKKGILTRLMDLIFNF